MHRTLDVNYQVALYDVDCYNRLKISSFLNYMQDAASRHAKVLKVDYSDLIGRGLSWVLSRAIIEVKAYPGFMDTVSVRTWPKAVDRLTSTRDFVITGEKGLELARATTVWVMLDVHTRRPQPLDEFRENIVELRDEYGIEGHPGKIDSSSAVFTKTQEFAALYSAIDYNRHLNNARYFDFISDMYPREHHEGHYITRAHINFLNEVKCGQVIRIDAEDTARPTQIIEAHKQGDGSRVFQALLTWL